MRMTPGLILNDREQRRLELAMEAPPKKRSETVFWLIAVLLLAAAFAYTVWTLNHSGPATGVL